MPNTKKRTEETVEKIRAKLRANKPAPENLATDSLVNENKGTAVSVNNLPFSMPSMLTQYFKDLDNIPNDSQNILKDIDSIKEIFEAIAPIFQILIEPIKLRELIETYREGIKESKNTVTSEGILNLAKKQFLYNLKNLSEKLNYYLEKDLEHLIKIRKTLYPQSQETLPVNEQINLTDLKNILEGISRIFPQIKFPEFKAEKRIKPSNKAFKIKQIEATPNHSTCLDILSLIIKPQEFSDKANFSDIQINHKSKRFNAYTALTVPKPETIEINDINLTLVKCFDWKDRKILRLIFTEALHHQGEFPLSFRWILEKLGELKTGGKTLEEKLADLRNRFLKYRSVSIRWKYKLGKKIEADSITGGNIFIIQTTDFYDRKRGENSYDIETNISLGNWFEINRNLIREFTRIPQKLLSINTTYHWRAFAIGEKICVLMRTNKEKILNSDSAYQVPIKLSMKCLLDEIINPLELKQCLEDSKKGYDFKDSFIKETQYLEKELGWKFNWIGLTENQSLNDFYNLVSFIAYVDSELECAILGEKLITEIVPPKVKPSKVPLTIEGDLVKKLRKNLKMTQTIFGKYLDYEQSYISKIERGSELASEDFIKALYKKYSSEMEKIK
jgi:hypothetical protein